MSRVEIRPFCNSDIPQLCELWNAHYAIRSEVNGITAQQIELIVLGKPYFSLSDLWVATRASEELAAVLLTGPLANDSLSDYAGNRRGMFAFLRRRPEDDTLLPEMIATVMAEGGSQVDYWCIGPALPNAAYNLGFGPGASIAGWPPQLLEKQGQAFNEFGFQPQERWQYWELNLDGFHLPMDRTLLNLRRTVVVERAVEEPRLPWWLACVFGHVDVYGYSAINRSDGRLIGDAIAWSLPFDFEAVRDRIWLYPPPRVPTSELQAMLTYLLSEIFQELQSQNVRMVCTTSRADDHALTQVLRRLGFSLTYQGEVLARQR